jgi:hypothetical protein
MAERADHGSGQGASPGREPGRPGDAAPGADLAPDRDPHLSGFAAGGEWDACPPSAALAVAVEAACGPEWRCAGASRDELLGLLRQWQAQESRAAAGKLAVLRALIKDGDQPLPGGGYHGDLPEGWTKSLTHEVAVALSMPVVSADRLMWLAWDMEGRLPGTGTLLAAGKLTSAKAKAVDEALQSLSAGDAAKAEAMILPDLPGKTYGQVARLAGQAAITVDPESATRRRRDAEETRSRVEMFREESGAAALAGRDMPTDQALAANANVCARALVYKESGVFPDGTRMDHYRAAAFLDLLNGVSADTRIATGLLPGASPAGGEPAGEPDDDENGGDQGGAAPCGEDPHGGPGGCGGGRQHSRGDPGTDHPGGNPPAQACFTPRPADLVLPLATLLGLAERPGEGYGLGPLDPDLCRTLAIAAAGSPDSRLCVTVTDPDAIAIGHGCARAPRRGRSSTGAEPARPAPPRGFPPLSARVNLTITAARLTELARETGPPGQGAWGFARDTDVGPSDGFGIWTLTLPSGGSLTVELTPVPTFECDHRHESHAYQPNDTLRHLVQVRDGECTFPPCSRPARETDFEHATPYDKGGRTCACNAGARSRACHQVKQSKGWNVTQPKPGWHQWKTPSGRIYLQGPKRYPA